MKRAERMQDRGANPLTSTIITSTRFDSVVRLINLPSYSSLLWTVGCYYNGVVLGIDWCGKQVETNRVVS